MMNFFQGFLLITLLSPSSSWALGTVLEGWLCQSMAREFCVIEKNTMKRVSVTSDHFEVRFDLKKLRLNDYVTLNGHRKNDQSFKALHVEFVGLQRVLGLWGTESGAIYNFADFSNLLVYFNGNQPNSYHLKYSIAPENSSDWTIFITTKDVSIGRLKVRDKNINIDFYDLNSGRIQNTLKLISLDNPQ